MDDPKRSPRHSRRRDAASLEGIWGYVPTPRRLDSSMPWKDLQAASSEYQAGLREVIQRDAQGRYVAPGQHVIDLADPKRPLKPLSQKQIRLLAAVENIPLPTRGRGRPRKRKRKGLPPRKRYEKSPPAVGGAQPASAGRSTASGHSDVVATGNDRDSAGRRLDHDGVPVAAAAAGRHRGSDEARVRRRKGASSRLCSPGTQDVRIEIPEHSLIPEKLTALGDSAVAAIVYPEG